MTFHESFTLSLTQFIEFKIYKHGHFEYKTKGLIDFFCELIEMLWFVFLLHMVRKYKLNILKS